MRPRLKDAGERVYPVVVHLTLPPWQRDALERLADRRGWTLSETVAQLLDATLTELREEGA